MTDDKADVETLRTALELAGAIIEAQKQRIRQLERSHALEMALLSHKRTRGRPRKIRPVAGASPPGRPRKWSDDMLEAVEQTRRALLDAGNRASYRAAATALVEANLGIPTTRVERVKFERVIQSLAKRASERARP